MLRKHAAALGILTLILASFAATATGRRRAEAHRDVHLLRRADGARGRRSDRITIFRWSTDEEREKLLTTLQEFGRDKLIDTLMKIRPVVGYMRTPNSIGYDLYYARNNLLPDGGRHVVMATNRRVAIREAQTAQRSMQYQLTVIELHIDQNGKGEGKMVPAAKISWDAKKKAIEIENYRALPVDLINVQAKKP